MKYGYSYIRFSTLEQARGDSYRRQTELSQKYADVNGITLDDSLKLTDLGVSAFRGTNVTSGRLGAFLQAIESGQVKPGSYLLDESLDRLSSNEVLLSFTLFIQILLKYISIITLTDNRVYSRDRVNDIGNLMYSLLVMTRAHE